MLKNILKLEGTQLIEKSAQKKVVGGFGPILQPSCYPGGSPVCCGTSQYQCGVGPSSGGTLSGYFQGNPVCNCF